MVPPPEDDDPLPFLAGLEGTVTLREDHLLMHDASVFGDWDLTEVHGFYSVFTSRGGRRVTVININRHELETTLGADLVYYNARYKSYVIVQYKRMTWSANRHNSGRTATYRPKHDRNLARQLKRMKAVEPAASSMPKTSDEYRLGPGISYLKICRPDLDLSSTELCQGMYVGTSLWDLLASESSGAAAGLVLQFDSVRYLNNTDFIALVRGGWIGSFGDVTEEIQGYISRALSNKHSVTLATASR